MNQPSTSKGTPDPERDPSLTDLPPDVASALGDLRAAAQAALGEQLVSMVLYGSGAEGRLRATSDVNIILVLSTFDPERLAQLRDPQPFDCCSQGNRVIGEWPRGEIDPSKVHTVLAF